MSVAGPVPEHEALVRELRLVRENGLRALRRLHLPALHQAAAAVGLTTTETQPEPPAIEKLIRMAVDRFDGGPYQEAAQYTFGLVGGTKFEIAPERRRQAARSCHVSTEQFRKSHEKVILEQTAEAVLALVHDAVIRHANVAAVASGAAQRLSGEPNLHDDVRDAPTTSSEGAVHPTSTRTATSERSPALAASRKRSRPRRHVLAWLVAVALVLEMVAGAGFLTRHYAAEPNGMTASDLEQRYDGKDPRGFDGENSRCADPPPSQIVAASSPPVMGPQGTQVGTVQLRTSPICPTVMWARVLWNGDEQSRYQMPLGWTLHVVMHRPDTNSRFDGPEPSTASRIPYALSGMIASARGCVYAEVYFTNGDVATESARTSCVQA